VDFSGPFTAVHDKNANARAADWLRFAQWHEERPQPRPSQPELRSDHIDRLTGHEKINNAV
jgi:hypothetical protein